MNRVELIEFGKEILQPMPLGNRRFEQSGGRVGVVFEQFQLRAVVCQIKAAVNCRWFIFPSLLDHGDCRVRNGQFLEAVVIDDVLGDLETHLV